MAPVPSPGVIHPAKEYWHWDFTGSGIRNGWSLVWADDLYTSALTHKERTLSEQDFNLLNREGVAAEAYSTTWGAGAEPSHSKRTCWT